MNQTYTWNHAKLGPITCEIMHGVSFENVMVKILSVPDVYSIDGAAGTDKIILPLEILIPNF